MRAVAIVQVLVFGLLPARASAGGQLEFVDATPSGCAPRSVMGNDVHDAMLSPDGADLYVIGNLVLSHFRRDAASGALTAAPHEVLGAYGAVMTPDGKQLLLARVSEGAFRLVVLDRDAVTGEVTVKTEIQDGVAGVVLSGFSVTVSPDGLHVYVAGASISRFERDAGSGNLTYLGNTSTPGAGDFQRRLLPSVDGLQVYSLGSIYPDHAILDVWARNPTTGDLTLLQRLAQNTAEAPLLETGALIASPDGTDVYTLGTGGFASPRLVHFRRAPATGLLTFLGGFGVGGLEAGGLTMRPDGAFVYVTEVNSFLLPSRASVFARDPGTGNLTFVDFLPLVPEHVVATSDHLYGAGGRTDYTALLPEASVHRIDGPTGTGALIDFEHYQPSVGAALLTPDGSNLYVHCPQDDAVVGFAVDAGTGALTPAGKLVDGRGGLAYESDMSVSADGTHVYVASLHGDGIAVLGRNPGTGALTFASAVLDDQDGIDGLGFVQRLAIAPDGGHVYAAPVPFATFYTEVGSDDVVSVLARDGGTGALTPIQSIGQSIPGLIGSFHPGDVTITPDGTYVYVTGDVDGVSGITPVQAAFRRAPATGMLTFERLIERAGYPTMGPDGRQLYLTRDGDVAVLRRNLGDGGATLQQTQSDDDVWVDAPIALAAASPYAHGLADRRTQIAALVTWRRDPVTGSLAPVQVLRSGVGGAPLGQPTDVVQTVDGRYVYVPDGGSNTVARYRHREPCTPAPAVGCRIPLRPRAASLQLSDRPGSTNKVFTLRWARGSAVTPADLGTPTTMTEYVACLYDAAGPQPVASLVAPAGETCGALPCWKPVPSGFAYSDPALTPDGLNKATVSAGADGRSRLIWKAKGPSVPPLGLPLQGPVVLQIQASNGTCWEATFPTATVNDGTTWKGKSG